MSNKQDYEEASKLAQSLLERTQDGKVEWFERDPDEFMYQTPTGFSFIVSLSDDRLSWEMLDDGGHSLIRISTQPDKEYWEMAEGERLVSKVLPDLFDAARRSALKVDQKVTEISEFLNSL